MSQLRQHCRSVLVVVFTIALLVLSQRTAQHDKMPDWEASCADGAPYFAASSYRAQSRVDRPPVSSSPSVILFQDTPNSKVHYQLASYRQIGTVWGLAYVPTSQSIYAATYTKRALPYGPSGPGAIYRINLESGTIEPFVVVPNAGPTSRRVAFATGSRSVDEMSAHLVGKTSLGGLDTSDDGKELFVMNLYDRRIYRYGLPSGTLLGSFNVGSQLETWSATGRPFALTYHSGKLYHGVVNDSAAGSDFVARVYRSNPDGSGLMAVATIDLRYDRDVVRLRSMRAARTKWGPWSDLADPKPGEPPLEHTPQPMLTDIAFAESGTMIVGLRDRFTDQIVSWVDERYETVTHGASDCINRNPSFCTPPLPADTPTPAVFVLAEEALGYGDILRAMPTGDAFDIETVPEVLDDENALRHGESAFGGLACMPSTNLIAATAFGVEESNSFSQIGFEGVYWYDTSTGNKTSREVVGIPGSFRDYMALLRDTILSAWADDERVDWTVTTRFSFSRDVGSLGDIETLCLNCGILPTPTPPPPSDTPVSTDTPTTVPTAVPPSETPTFTSTPTFTPVPPTTTSTPLPKPVYLPVALFERCDPGRARGDIILVIDTSSSMVGEKIVAARAAAHNFVNAMTLPQDQVGIVTFNAAGSILSRLTGNGTMLHAAIDQISTAPGTRIDAGLDLAIQLLAGPERKASNTPVVIVMTDGLQAAEPERPQALASQLRSSGVVIYAIGLGSDVDVAYLTRLAGDAARMKLSPTAAELSAIYLEIARLIPCAPSSFWGGR